MSFHYKKNKSNKNIKRPPKRSIKLNIRKQCLNRNSFFFFFFFVLFLGNIFYVLSQVRGEPESIPEPPPLPCVKNREIPSRRSVLSLPPCKEFCARGSFLTQHPLIIHRVTNQPSSLFLTHHKPILTTPNPCTTHPIIIHVMLKT